MKTLFSRRWRQALWVLGAGFATGFIVLSSVGTVVAADTKTADTKASTQGSASVEGSYETHSADTAIRPGTIVQLADTAKSKVSPAAFAKPDQMYGVVITGNNLPVTVTDSDVPNALYVGLSGTHDVLVSTQSGPINPGDYITISAIDGIGMLAEPGTKVKVFGRAAEGFDGKANVLGKVQLKDKSGHSAQAVNLGSISVVIDIRDNPEEKSTKAKVPEFLQRVGEAVAEKPVSPLRIYLSIGITGLCTTAAIALLYAGVRSSIIAIGRNPLSKKSIIRTLVEIILTSLIILIVGLFAVYLLLKL